MRPLITIMVIAGLWAGTAIAYLLLDTRALPSYTPIVMIGILWLTALGIYALLWNPRGEFRRYVVAAAISLIAAAIVIDRLIGMFATRAPSG